MIQVAACRPENFPAAYKKNASRPVEEDPVAEGLQKNLFKKPKTADNIFSKVMNSFASAATLLETEPIPEFQQNLNLQLFHRTPRTPRKLVGLRPPPCIDFCNPGYPDSIKIGKARGRLLRKVRSRGKPLHRKSCNVLFAVRAMLRSRELMASAPSVSQCINASAP